MNMRLGPVKTVDVADGLLETLSGAGHSEAVIVVE